MGLTQRVKSINRDRRPGRLVIRADDPSLTPYAGLAITGELARKLRLVELINAELAAAGRVAPIKQRRRGLSPGELTVAIAEAQLAGAECFDDIEVVRADRTLAPWRASLGFDRHRPPGSWPPGSGRRISAQSSAPSLVVATSLTACSVATRARM